MTENHKSCPFMGIPVELRLKILDYILPRNRDNSRTIAFPTCVRQIDRDFPYTNVAFTLQPNHRHPVDSTPSRLALRRYLLGIGLVSHQLHEESNKVLHSFAFVIKICERSLSAPIYDSFEGMCPGLDRHIWVWNSLLPGLDLSRVHELEIRIQPSENPAFWLLLHRCLEAFCKKLNERIGADGLRRLMVNILETEPGLHVDRLNVPLIVGEKANAVADDYACALDLVRRILRNMRACIIRVPSWAREDKQLMALLEYTQKTVCLPREVPYLVNAIGSLELDGSRFEQESETREAEHEGIEAHQEREHTRTHRHEQEIQKAEAFNQDPGQGGDPEKAHTLNQQELPDAADGKLPDGDTEGDAWLNQWVDSVPKWAVADSDLFKKRAHEKWGDWYDDASCCQYFSCWWAKTDGGSIAEV